MCIEEGNTLRNVLGAAIKKQVIDYNRDIGDEGLIEAIADTVVEYRIQSINTLNDDIVQGNIKVEAEQTLSDKLESLDLSGTWVYVESLEGVWALYKVKSLAEAINQYTLFCNSIIINDGQVINIGG